MKAGEINLSKFIDHVTPSFLFLASHFLPSPSLQKYPLASVNRISALGNMKQTYIRQMRRHLVTAKTKRFDVDYLFLL